MRILIVEDEQIAARTLEHLLAECDPLMEVIGVADSVKAAIEYLSTGSMVDLIFLDIHLGDGLAFELFRLVKITVPVIFVTAFDQYAVKAFELNSLDYILKPVRKERLQESLARLPKKGDNYDHSMNARLETFIQQMEQQTSLYKRRFLVKNGSRLIPVATEDIAYFFRSDDIVRLTTKSGRISMINYTMDELEKTLDPVHFFRLNRQVIASVAACAQIVIYFKGKLKIELHPPAPFEILVSQEKAGLFRKWLEG